MSLAHASFIRAVNVITECSKHSPGIQRTYLHYSLVQALENAASPDDLLVYQKAMASQNEIVKIGLPLSKDDPELARWYHEVLKDSF